MPRMIVEQRREESDTLASENAAVSLRLTAPYIIDAMVRCGEARRITMLRDFLNEFSEQIECEKDLLAQEVYSSLAMFSSWGQAMERRYGEGALLMTDHPTVQHSLIHGLMDRAEIEGILVMQSVMPESVSREIYTPPPDFIRGVSFSSSSPSSGLSSLSESSLSRGLMGEDADSERSL